MKRSFDRIGIDCKGGKRRPGYSVTCSKCSRIETIVAANTSGSLPPEATRLKFAQKGWTVGDRTSHDVCPECSRKKLMAVSNKPPNVVHMAAPGIEPPRVMSREDKRLIFGKIDGVYIDEKRGYEAGWSDKRVAGDLGVPLAWVRGIREQDFGPEGLDAESRAALEAAKQLTAELGAVESKVTALVKELQELKGRFSRTERAVDEVRKLTVVGA